VGLLSSEGRQERGRERHCQQLEGAVKTVPVETDATITRYADEQTERRAHLDRLADRIAALGYTVADNL
jgi:hypothetical protein